MSEINEFADLEREYDEKFLHWSDTRVKSFFTRLSREEILENLKTDNWRHWCKQAEHTTRSCEICHWPLDLSTIAYVSVCEVCREMEKIQNESKFWRDLKAEESRKRTNMGLSGG